MFSSAQLTARSATKPFGEYMIDITDDFSRRESILSTMNLNQPRRIRLRRSSLRVIMALQLMWELQFWCYGIL